MKSWAAVEADAAITEHAPGRLVIYARHSNGNELHSNSPGIRDAKQQAQTFIGQPLTWRT